MKSFDLEAAKRGAEVCFADGTPVRLICFDRFSEIDDRSIVGLYRRPNEKRDIIISFDRMGQPYGHEDSSRQLFMKPRKTGGWINIYSGRMIGNRDIYGTKSQADRDAGGDRIACIYIEWEE